jgi:hypothetical protein
VSHLTQSGRNPICSSGGDFALRFHIRCLCIGRAAAVAFAEDSAKVVVAGRREVSQIGT